MASSRSGRTCFTQGTKPVCFLSFAGETFDRHEISGWGRTNVSIKRFVPSQRSSLKPPPNAYASTNGPAIFDAVRLPPVYV